MIVILINVFSSPDAYVCLTLYTLLLLLLLLLLVLLLALFYHF